MPVSVLLVDDSAVIRGLMNKALTVDPQITIVGTAANGEMAITMARNLQPDVIILDIEMPVMDGLTALPELLKVNAGCKIIMASTLTLRNAGISMQALELGASDYLAKPSAKMGQEVDAFYRELIDKVKALGEARKAAAKKAADQKTAAASQPTALLEEIKFSPAALQKVLQPSLASSSVPLYQTGVKALAIASSTGGPQALVKLFEQLKGRLTGLPIFITQHMPPNFTTILAEHIGKAGGRTCIEAKGGEIATPGTVYVAPGDFHMTPEKNNVGEVVIRINQDPAENFCRPAADPMLRALSGIYGKHLAVVVLTGMGQDGMEGAKIAVSNGGSVIAQDEATCVVYGMPKAVVEQNICRAILPLPEIGTYLIQQIEGRV